MNDASPIHNSFRLTRCPGCDFDLSQAPPAGKCPRCRVRYDDSTIAIPGAATTSGEFLALVLGWITTALLAASLLPAPFVAIVAGAMIIHLGARALLGDAHAGRRLVINDTGVALARAGRRPEILRWHLFEQARIDLRADGANDPSDQSSSRWRLTLVNAYKPSISTYLHRRGTDAPIFAESIVFTFHAPAGAVEALQQRLDKHLQTARRDYRALDLRKLHLEPPDPDEVFALRICPRCEYDLAGLPPDGRCPECGRPRAADTFNLPGRVISPRPAIVMIPALALMLGIVYQLSGYPALSRWLLAFGALTGGLWLVSMLMFSPPRPRRTVVTRDGLEIWYRDHDPVIRHWWELPAWRRVQVGFGRWRIAFWDRPKDRIGFSDFFFNWYSFPPGRPVLDIVIAGDEQTGRMICDEIERRISRRAPNIAPASLSSQAE